MQKGGTRRDDPLVPLPDVWLEAIAGRLGMLKETKISKGYDGTTAWLAQGVTVLHEAS